MTTEPAYDKGVIASLIADALQRPGWSQARLARALDARPQTINKWVSGENTPPMARWSAIEAALVLPAGSFLEAAGMIPAQTAPAMPAALSGAWLKLDERDRQRLIRIAQDLASDG